MQCRPRLAQPSHNARSPPSPPARLPDVYSPRHVHRTPPHLRPQPLPWVLILLAHHHVSSPRRPSLGSPASSGHLLNPGELRCPGWSSENVAGLREARSVWVTACHSPPSSGPEGRIHVPVGPGARTHLLVPSPTCCRRKCQPVASGRGLLTPNRDLSLRQVVCPGPGLDPAPMYGAPRHGAIPHAQGEERSRVGGALRL